MNISEINNNKNKAHKEKVKMVEEGDIAKCFGISISAENTKRQVIFTTLYTCLGMMGCF